MDSLEAPAIIDATTLAMPDERFKNAGEVNDVCGAMILADRPRSGDRAKVNGMIDGNRPYNQAALTKNAQGWRSNVNFREGEGTIQSNRTPYYDLVTEVDPCVNIQIDYGRGDQQADWAATVAQEFHRMVFGWNSFDWHIMLQQSEMITHGWGTHLWLSKLDWRCKTKTMRNVLFPNGTTSDLEDLEMFMVRDPQKASQVWASIRNEKAARAMGWFPDKVKEALARAGKVSATNERFTPESVQAAMKRGDLGHAYARSSEVIYNHLFCIEFQGGKNDRGGITHYIIEEGQSEYLYKKRHRFDSFSNVLAFFPYDIGSEGTIHSIRGLGTRIYPFMELSNRLKNSMTDSVLISSGILLSQQGSVDLTKLQLQSIGPMKLLPSGVKPEKADIGNLEQGPLALSRELQETVSENTKTYRQGVDQSSRERTAFEVSVNQADSAKLQKSANNMYYRNLDRFYKEMLRRACNPNIHTEDPGGEQAVAFQNACLRAGVPKEALSKIVTVQAARAIGNGSASSRLVAIQTAMQVLYPAADDVSRNNMRRDLAGALIGHAQAGRYVPPIDAASVPTNDDALAVLENDALVAGGDALVTSSQNHLRHVGRHLQKAGQLIADIQKGRNPQEVLQAWEVLGPHIATHMGFLEQDPTRKQQFKQVHQQFDQLSKFADQLAQQVAEQQQAQAKQQAEARQQPPVDQEFMLQKAQIEADHALKLQKLQGDQAIKRAKAENDIQLKSQKTAASIMQSTAKQRADTAIAANKQASEERQSLPYARPGSTSASE